MALETAYCVNSNGGSDSNTGIYQPTGEDPFVAAKQHLSAVLALITEPLTHDVYIYLKDSTTLYTGDFEVQGISALGGDYQLIIQPGPNSWSQEKYEAGELDPLGGTGGFDPRASTFGVKLQLTMELLNCGVIELRGLWFYATSSVTSIVKLMKRADLNACYCRFEGLGGGVLAMFDSQFCSENCYYTGCSMSTMALYDSNVHMAGNNYLVNPVVGGVHIGARSQLVVRATPDYSDHNTLYIETTLPRIENFAAVKAAAGSTILVQDETALPLNYGAILTGFLKVHHNLPKLRKGQVAIALDAQSKLIGADQVTCTKLNLKGETVPMSTNTRIVTNDDDSDVDD